VVLINSFLYERLTDENFHQAIDLWFENKEECKFRFGHISDWNTSRVTNMERVFHDRRDFNLDIGQWNVGRVTDMGSMFYGASEFNQDLGQWNVSNVTDMGSMFHGASQFNGDIGHWDVSRGLHPSCLIRCRDLGRQRTVPHRILLQKRSKESFHLLHNFGGRFIELYRFK
jgi:surface protein